MPAQESRKVATTLERLAAQGANTSRIADAVVLGFPRFSGRLH